MQKQCQVFGILRYILASQSMVIMPMRCDFNGTKASADSEERSVSVGSRHLHTSPGQEDTKVVRQAQMDSYYERFCETVAMGLPGRGMASAAGFRCYKVLAVVFTKHIN